MAVEIQLLGFTISEISSLYTKFNSVFRYKVKLLIQLVKYRSRATFRNRLVESPQ